MSTRTAERDVQQTSARLSLVDIVGLVSTVALLVSFVVLPWVIEAAPASPASACSCRSRPP